MSNQTYNIQQALTDVAVLRHALDQSEQDSSDARLVGITLDANLLLQGTAFMTALALCLVEVFSGNSMTQTLINGSQVNELKLFGIGLMGLIIAGLLTALYFILWRAARHNGEEVKTYIVRNFRYAKNLSFISDLLIKFITIALLVLAGKADWLAPVLMAFTGDYLLQGRFFTLSTRVSIVLGIACLIAAVVQFILGSSLLLVSLSGFALIAGLSTARLVIRYWQQTAANA